MSLPRAGQPPVEDASRPSIRLPAARGQGPDPDPAAPERDRLDPAALDLAALERDGLDLRDVSAGVETTCAALDLALHEGDLLAAERLAAFLRYLVPDCRLLAADVLQPLLRSELPEATAVARRLRLNTARDLLVRLRRPCLVDGDATVLLTGRGDHSITTLHLVGLLLDECRVPTVTLETVDDRDLARQINRRHIDAACVALSDPSSAEAVTADIARLRQQKIPVVLTGDAVLDDETAAAAMAASATAGRVSEAADRVMLLRGPLTAAEAQVLSYAADGYTNSRIAHELDISVSAVKARLEGTYGKLGAADRSHAVAIALRNRWIR